MAKKPVARTHEGQDRAYTKVIKMVKSPKNGAYCFEEKILHKDEMKNFFEK